MSTTFADLGIPTDLLALLDKQGVREPFPIQSAVIADALAGRDVLGRAPTGSGKTLAFGLPVVMRLQSATKRRPTGLILAPTRELAEQITTTLRPFAAARGHRVVSLYGGVGERGQRNALDAGAALVVACPGRLEDLLRQRALMLADVETVVIDEADRMLDMGFLPAVERIMALTNVGRRQTMLFTATLDRAVEKFAAKTLTDPTRHSVGSTGVDMTTTRHLFWRVARLDRVEHTAQIIDEIGTTLVFCATRHGCDRLEKQLRQRGVETTTIHGGHSQAQRDRALATFKAGRVRALVATDVAARGIHVDEIASVVHFDLPVDDSTYVHRSGRTARAGASGVVVTLVDETSVREAAELQRKVGLPKGTTSPDVSSLRDRRPVAAASTEPARAATNVVSVEPEVATSANAPRHGRRGIVKFFHARKGFGFIGRQDDEDLFVHFSNIVSDGFRTLAEGQVVSYEVGDGQRGPEALNVQPV